MKKIFTFYGIICLLLASCQTEQHAKKERPFILTTTGMLADAAKNIVQDSLEVIALMGPGVDPHLYKATQGDLKKMRQAAVIFYNGLHLEGKMGDAFQNASQAVAVGDLLPKTQLLFIGKHQYDPHIWFDIQLWKLVVREMNKTLQNKYPAQAPYFQKNTTTYLARLDSLESAIKQQLATIPPAKKVLITAHDAFSYFGKAYQVEVKGLQGISTAAEYGIKDISDLAQFIMNRKIPCIFIETSVSTKSVEAVMEACKAKGYPLVLGGKLYSDAMGTANTPEGTYIGMFAANVQQIVKGLNSK